MIMTPEISLLPTHKHRHSHTNTNTHTNVLIRRRKNILKLKMTFSMEKEHNTFKRQFKSAASVPSRLFFSTLLYFQLKLRSPLSLSVCFSLSLLSFSSTFLFQFANMQMTVSSAQVIGDKPVPFGLEAIGQ